MELVAVGVHRWDGGGVAAPVARTGAMDGQGFPGLWWELEEMAAPACTGGSFRSPALPLARQRVAVEGTRTLESPEGLMRCPPAEASSFPRRHGRHRRAACAGGGVAGRLRCPMGPAG